MPSRSARPIARRLGRSDPVLAKIIHRVGPSEPPVRPAGFAALGRAIVFQQISGAAGSSIVRRLCRRSGTRGFPPPVWFLSAPVAELRRAGLSPQKVRYLKDLAARVTDRRIEFRRFRSMTDEAIIEHLTGVKGIGRWTAQMFLIFSLGRPDVMPSGDLGVRKAVQRAYGYRRLPAEVTVERLGRRWAPYRSHATHYLWRSLDDRPPELVRGARRGASPTA